ncbi:hypothetical protein E2C01_056105 [Portunus trituberculatus]|uniref:Uncharacterized protein n=1 Tax=Portunus trituberculatus TaxID=210409 RepID=A0A5B7GXA1_PORTR|nr:hypothetical protein [Portunus trituberculatus]
MLIGPYPKTEHVEDVNQNFHNVDHQHPGDTDRYRYHHHQQHSYSFLQQDPRSRTHQEPTQQQLAAVCPTTPRD